MIKTNQQQTLDINSSSLSELLPGYDAIATASVGDYFDCELAAKAIDFFPTMLKHNKGKFNGQPFILEPWQQAIIGSIFGWCREDGSRRYRWVYIECPRKQGKSSLSAGIALYSLLFDEGEGLEVYSCASDREQAGIVFQMAKDMINSSATLRKATAVYQKSIMYPAKRNKYQVMSSDANSAHGRMPSCVIFDELHTQPNGELYRNMTTGSGPHKQPLFISLTTAGYDRNSICYQMHTHAEKVRDNVINDSAFLPVLYTLGDEEDWTCEKVWRRVQPNLDVTVPLQYMKDECEKAKQQPSYENTFKRLMLCQWTQQESRWLKMTSFDLNSEEPDLDYLLGRSCYAGLDLSSTRDLTALVLVFPDYEDGTYDVLTYPFVPEDNATVREKKDRVPYLQWAKEGHIELTPGEVVDYDRVREKFNELAELYKIEEIAIDRWNATQLSTQLSEEGHTVVSFPQSFRSMTGPTKALESLITNGKIRHGNHPVLRWCASNVQVETSSMGEDVRPSKKKSTEKIDCVVALIMAMGRALVQRQDNQQSIYDSRGIISL